MGSFPVCIVEFAEARAILDRPVHPYTQALMAAMPKPDPAQRIARGVELGEPPSQFERASGCAYALRCPLATGQTLGCSEVTWIVFCAVSRCCLRPWECWSLPT